MQHGRSWSTACPGQRSGVSPDTIPGSRISMHVFSVEPGETAVPGNEPEAETAAYIVSGSAQILAGEDFEKVTPVAAGDFYFTPARLPHLILNSGDEPAQGRARVVARSIDHELRPQDEGRQWRPRSQGCSQAVGHERDGTDARHAARSRHLRRDPRALRRSGCATSPSSLTREGHLITTARHTPPPTRSPAGRESASARTSRSSSNRGPATSHSIRRVSVHLVDHPFDDEPWKGVLARCPENTVVNVGD